MFGLFKKREKDKWWQVKWHNPLKYHVWLKCRDCSGSGIDAIEYPADCCVCNGRGTEPGYRCRACKVIRYLDGQQYQTPKDSRNWRIS